MRIAVCLSGQPRTWKKCVESWENLFKYMKEKHNAEIDIFFHAWDSNTTPHGTQMAILPPDGYKSDIGSRISEVEKQELIDRLKPKSYLFEPTELGLKKIDDTVNENLRHDRIYGKSVVSWAAPQFYSLMRVAHLKKKYEFENNFRYDVCIKLRFDLFFDALQIHYFTDNDFRFPEPTTVYSCHTSRDDMFFPFYRLGDIFWYADSVCFDRMCDFYRWIPIIGMRSFSGKESSTEHALYFYLKMLKMNVQPISVDPKVYRSDDYIRIKVENGLPGELGGHELI